MRQAGRYLPEYRSIRAKTPFAELCRNPELCAQVMDHTVRRLGVDAAILFSDLLFILEPLGFQLEYGEGEGPQIANPIRRGSDVDRTRELESPDALSFVCDAVRATRAAIPATLPLIGFSGAPFTLASYAIEGGASRTFLSTKTFMAADEGAWTALCQKLVRALVVYLNAQIEAGAQAVQLFDSWVGHLGVDDYRRYVLPHTRAVIRGLAPGVPVIHFGTGNPALTASMAEAGGDVIGVDWRAPIDVAWAQAGSDRAIQGNLDPACLLLPREDIRQRVAAVLRAAGGRPGHIFNLGHGVMKETPPDHARAMVDFVHELSHSKPHGP
jgi:uroporphyrinogen decarboxylase